MNVRIGNDIRLNLTVKGPKDYDQSNIKQLRAYLVNTTMQIYTEPWAPCDCACDRHKYHHMPCNRFTHIPVNPAFGEGPLRPNYGHPWHHFDHACCHNPHKPHTDMAFLNNIYTYQASSKVLAEKNKIQVYFPAHAQIACGNYKLVIVLSVYESGWGRCDLHTYTIDYPDVFTLVDSSEGLSGDIVIDVDTNSASTSGNSGEGSNCNCDHDALVQLINQLQERITELEDRCHCGQNTEFSVSPTSQSVEWNEVNVPREYRVISSTNWSIEEI